MRLVVCGLKCYMLALWSIAVNSCSSAPKIEYYNGLEFSRNEENLYTLRIEIKKSGILPLLQTVFAVIDGQEYQMSRSGDAYQYEHHAPCSEGFSYCFKIHEHRTFPYEREENFFIPKHGSYTAKIIPAGDDIIINRTKVAFVCAEKKHPRCISEYIIVKNNSMAPVVVEKFILSENKTPEIYGEMARPKKSFEVIPNGSFPPLTLNCADSLLFVVCFNHEAIYSEGKLIIKTSHPKFREIPIHLEGKYTLAHSN